MITLTILALIYFLPTLIASHRGHHITRVLLLNLFFGWTGIGWFALVLWAVLSAPRYILIAPMPYTSYAIPRRW